MFGVVDRLPVRLRTPARRVVEVIATSLWFAPLVAGALAIAAAVFFISVDPIGDNFPLPMSDRNAARSALTSILSATIAATSLVITGTIISLQLATGQYSPRLLRDVLTDRSVRWTLATYVGTVVYLLITVSRITEGRLPVSAVVVGLFLGVVVIGLLVFFVHHIVQRLRLETIIGDVTERTLTTVRNTHPTLDVDKEVPEVPDESMEVPARRSGYVQAATLEQLALVAADHKVNLQMRLRVGDFLTAGTTAVWAWRDSDDTTTDLPDVDKLADAVDNSIVLGVDRTLDGDPAYGVRHLVDIGMRAVSPGINDPTTAVQAIDHATAILVELASRNVTAAVDEKDGYVAVLPKASLEAILELAQSQLLHYGGGDPLVVEALCTQLRDVLEAGTADERVDIVRMLLERIEHDIERRDHAPWATEILEGSVDRVRQLLTSDDPDTQESPAG